MVVSLSAKGLTHGEISAHLQEIYGADPAPLQVAQRVRGPFQHPVVVVRDLVQQTHDQPRSSAPGNRWSQNDLARRLGTNDAAAISRYKNGKDDPHRGSRDPPRRDLRRVHRLPAHRRCARRPFGDADEELTERIGMASRLPAPDKAAIAHIIDGLLANNRIRAALDQAQ